MNVHHAIKTHLAVAAILAMCATVFAESKETPRERSVRRYSGPAIDSNVVAMIQFDLRDIDNAKDGWAIENNKTPKDPISWADIAPFLQGGSTNPPMAGRYEINPVTKDPEYRISLSELRKYIWEKQKQAEVPNKPPAHVPLKAAPSASPSVR